jgi:two-component system cell cycle sensor histidine kinase/response regulator CckA
MQPALPGIDRRRILVIEDDQEILGTLAGLLEEEGYEVQSFSDGREALDQLRRGLSPDLIVLDLMMPGMDGWEFRTIQRADPQLADIPVVAISADTSAKAAAIDATRFLRKPFRFSELLDVVRKIIADREQRRIRARLAEAERLASLGTLAAGAAHEIANPLSFTVANLGTMDEQLGRMSQLLERITPGAGAPDESTLKELRTTLDDVRDLLADGRVGAERVSRVVRNLQSLVRRQEEPHRPVELGKVIESAITLAWNQIRHRARLVRQLGELPLMEGSEYRLGQLFVNLLLNAAQAIHEGSAQTNEIRVSVRSDDRGIVAEVQDSGEGMAQETRARLFEPFFTTKPGGVGTGLGLSICQSVVLEHAGTIEVESEPGKGSLFRVILPVRPPAAAADLAEQSQGPVATRRGHVLIVDDEPQLAWAMKRLLDLEHEVVAVTHGREALDRMAAGERFDVIVCDLTMPYMNGEELFREVERRFGPGMAARMLFVTGGTLSEKTRLFFEQVRNPRLYKPFEPDDLRAQVRKLMPA